MYLHNNIYVVPQSRALNKVNRHFLRIWPDTINRVNISLEMVNAKKIFGGKIAVLGQQTIPFYRKKKKIARIANAFQVTL